MCLISWERMQEQTHVIFGGAGFRPDKYLLYVVFCTCSYLFVGSCNVVCLGQRNLGIPLVIQRANLAWM